MPQLPAGRGQVRQHPFQFSARPVQFPPTLRQQPVDLSFHFRHRGAYGQNGQWRRDWNRRVHDHADDAVLGQLSEEGRQRHR